ncbi:MAG: aspartate carbamoyltransferase catalytic subunit, partial [Bacteroidota bacterium]
MYRSTGDERPAAGNGSTAWRRKDLLGLADLSPAEIGLILDTAVPCKEIFGRAIRKLPTLRGKTIVTLFYEPSTRTRTSFEVAAKWLGADTVSIAVAQSSVVKGESFVDTAKTIQAAGADVIVLRHSMAGAARLLAETVEAAVINAGDGAHEHPTQALLDLFTIRERKGRIDGLRVVIVGDIRHSRVARSDIYGLTKLGAQVTVVGPPTLLPPGLEELGVGVSTNLDEALAGADVVNVLRLQLERQKKGLFPSAREYARAYGMNRDRLARLAPDALLMHPGPANLGVEITEEAAEDRRSVITT